MPLAFPATVQTAVLLSSSDAFMTFAAFRAA